MPRYNQRVKDGNNYYKPSLIVKIFDIQQYNQEYSAINVRKKDTRKKQSSKIYE